MSTVEAAASLFGPEEPESDPFATLGTEEDTTTTSNTNDLFLGQENTPPLDFFNASSDNPPLSHSSEALRFEPPYGSGFHLQDPSQTTYNQTQEWYGERGQLRAQEQSSPETIPVGNVVFSMVACSCLKLNICSTRLCGSSQLSCTLQPL
jgi:hypothetical protein